MSGNMRELPRRRNRAHRDPSGTAALFSPAPRPHPGTVVVECNACGDSTPVSYLDFARANVPIAVWLPPVPGLHFNRYMSCPACSRRTWVRAHWTG